MAYFTLYPGDDTVLKVVREALPKNPHVSVETKKRLVVRYYWRYRVKLPHPIKLVGVAQNGSGLVFTFGNGTRSILPFGNKISVVVKKEVESWLCDPYKARITFKDTEGKKIIITLQH